MPWVFNPFTGNLDWTAAAASGGGFTEQTTTATGAQNDFDLGAHLTYLRSTGAAPVFSGFSVLGAAPSAGDRVVIDIAAAAGSTVKVLRSSGLSTLGNRILTPSTNGQIIGVGGRMDLVYDGADDMWREALITPGDMIAVPFNAADYTASGSMTWTLAAGDIVQDAYIQYGNLVTLISTLDTTTVGGTPSTELRKAFPAGFTAKNGEQWSPVVMGFDNGVGSSLVYSNLTTQSNAYLRIRRQDAAAFTAATNTTWIYIPKLIFEMN